MSNVDQHTISFYSNDVHFDVTDDMIYLFKTFNRSEKRLDVHDIRCVKGKNFDKVLKAINSTWNADKREKNIICYFLIKLLQNSVKVKY